MASSDCGSGLVGFMSEIWSTSDVPCVRRESTPAEGLLATVTLVNGSRQDVSE